VEASFAGRATVMPGDVLLHGRFDCHANNAISRRGPQILRLPWPDDAVEGHFRVSDPDLLVRLAERDPFEAAAQLRSTLEVPAPREFHWAERLAHALVEESVPSLRDWAEHHDVAPATVSRRFRQFFGVSPKLFRLEARARRAWGTLIRSDEPLTAIAHQFGFSDLPHMSRSIGAFTGHAPSAWRADQVRSS